MDGLVVFTVTPTDGAGEISSAALLPQIDHLLAAGVDGIALFGSTGAIGSFTPSERKRFTEEVLAHVAGRVPVAVGTGAMTTREAVELSKHAAQVGASACLVVPITYWELEDREVLAHYQAIDEAITIPIFVYNNPALTGVDMKPPLLAQLAALRNVAYLKESARELARIRQLDRMTAGRLRIFAGRDNSALEGLLVGARGWASGVANVIPRGCKELLARVQRGEIAGARELSDELAPLVDFLFQRNLASGCHAALALLGRPVGEPRQPILPLTAADRATLAEILIALKRWT